MTRKPARAAVVVAIVALAALVGGGLFWMSRRGDDPADGAPGAGAAARRPDDILAARRAARAARGAKDRTPAAASGTVRDAKTRAPIAGAVVLLSPASFLGARDDAAGEAPPPLSARTDAQGGFRLERVPPGRYRVSASAPGYLPGELLDVLVRAGEPRTDLELALATGGRSLGGTVSDVGGGPVAGALVSARLVSGASLLGTDAAPAATFTDDRGGYRLDLAEGTYEVTASHADYVTGGESLLLHGGPATLDFTLTPGASVSGVVLSRADRRPVPGAIVSASGGRTAMDRMGDLGELAGYLGAGAVVADAQGRFTLRGLGSGAIELSALARGFTTREPTVVEVRIAEAQEGVEILVEPALTVSGFVVRQGHEDEGVPGVLVGGIQMKGGPAPTAFDETDETGYFEIFGLSPGRYALVAAKDGLLPSLMRTMVTVEDEDVDDVLVIVETGATLRGFVEPRGAATLSLQVDEKDFSPLNLLSMAGAALVHGRAGDDGAFELRGVPQGAFTLVARTSAGHKGALPVVVKLDDQDGLVVKLEPRAAIAGQVVDARGAPVAGVEVNLWSDRGRDRAVDFGEIGRGDVRTGEDGRFEAVGLEPGTYSFNVRDGEGSLAFVPEGEPPPPVEVAAAERKQGVVLRVEALSGVIRGRVIDASGAPVADAWVVAIQGGHRGEFGAMARGGDAPPGGEAPPSDEDAPESSRWSPSSRPVLTGADGRFKLERLRDRPYDLTADAGGARGHKRGVEPGADVTLRLKPLAAVAGVVSRGGQPVTDYEIDVDGPTSRDKHVVADDGRYLIQRLDPGAYDVRVTSDAGAVKTKVTLVAGQTATLDLALEPWGEITGVIVDAFTGKPLSGLNVLANSHEVDDSGEQAMGMLTGGGPKTDAEGRFRIGKLGPGRGSLIAFSGMLSGFEPLLNESYTLAPGEQKDLGTLRALTSARLDEDDQGDLGFSAGPRAAAAGERDAGSAATPLVVYSVDAAGPAAAAGLLANDEIVAIDGHPVAVIGSGIAGELLTSARVKPGQVVRLSVVREGKPVAAEIAITARARPKPAGE